MEQPGMKPRIDVQKSENQENLHKLIIEQNCEHVSYLSKHCLQTDWAIEKTLKKIIPA